MDENPYSSPSVSAEPAKEGKRSDFGPLRMAATGLFAGLTLSSSAGAATALIAWLPIAAIANTTRSAPVFDRPTTLDGFVSTCFVAIIAGGINGVLIGSVLGPAFGLAAALVNEKSRRRLRHFSVWLYCLGHALFGVWFAQMIANEAGLKLFFLSPWAQILGGVPGAVAGASCGWWTGQMLGNVAWGKAHARPEGEEAPDV